MKILVHFKDQKVPNAVYNMFGQRFTEILDFRIEDGFLIIDRGAPKIPAVAINSNIVSAFELGE